MKNLAQSSNLKVQGSMFKVQCSKFKVQSSMSHDISLSAELRSMARKLNLCDKWFSEWRDDTDKQGLIDKYHRGSDFCVKHHYPSNEYISAHFERDLLRGNGILVDDDYSLLNPVNAMILGNSKSTIRINGRHHAVIHVRDNADVKIVAKNEAFVLVHVLDSATVHAEGFNTSRLVVFRNSKSANITVTGKAITEDDLDYLK